MSRGKVMGSGGVMATLIVIRYQRVEPCKLKFGLFQEWGNELLMVKSSKYPPLQTA